MSSILEGGSSRFSTPPLRPADDGVPTRLLASSVLVSVLLVLPSFRLWFQSPLDLIRHEFDFFLGFFAGGVRGPEPLTVFSGRVLQSALLVAAGVLYVAIAARLRQVQAPVPSSPLILHAGLLAFFFSLGLPWLSPDVFYYIGLGWLEARYDLDPFLHAIAQTGAAATDPMFTNVLPGFRTLPGTYGPLFQALATGLAALSFGNIKVALVLFKLVSLACHVAASTLVVRLAGPRAPFAFYAFACSPVVLLSAITGMHNDHLMVVFVLSALALRRADRPFSCGLAFACACGVKYAPLIALPLFVADWMLRGRSGRKVSVRGPLLFLAGFALPLAFFALRYPSFPSSLLSAIRHGSGVFRSSVHFVLGTVDRFVIRVPGPAISRLLLATFLFLAVASLVLLVRDRLADRPGALERAWVFLLISYFLTLNSSNHEWYLTWLFGPALVGAGVAADRLSVRLSAWFMPLVIFTAKNPTNVLWAANVTLYLLLVTFGVPFLVSCFRRESGADALAVVRDSRQP